MDMYVNLILVHHISLTSTKHNKRCLWDDI